MSVPLEHDYIGLSEPSSTSKFSISSSQRDNKNVLNLKATDLRLGLPGLGLDVEESSCKNSPTKNNVAGAKRGFSDAIFDGRKCGFNAGLECEKMEQSVPSIVEEKKKASVTKSQVVGWPPIRSFRKNTKAPNSSKNGDATEGNSACRGCHYVKVSMDGAPYLRKVDLKTCKNYTQLSTALEKMFNCFTLGQCSSSIRGKEGLNESNLKDILHCAECALTYEDKDGDWMLVGDVPWEMFVDSCNRLRIMKGSEAIGLGMLNC